MKLIRTIKASQDFKKDLKMCFKKSPKEAFNYFKKLCKNNKNISSDIIKIIFNEGYIDEFTEQLLKYKKNIPDIVLNLIAKDSDDSLKLVEQLLKYKKNIPDIILNSIAKDKKNSLEFVKMLNYKNIPDVVLQKIQQNVNFYNSKKYNKIKKFLNKFSDFIEKRYANFNCNSELSEISNIEDYSISSDKILFDQNLECIPETMSGLGKGAKYDIYIEINIQTEEVDFKISGEIIRWTSSEDYDTLKEISEQKHFTINQFMQVKGK